MRFTAALLHPRPPYGSGAQHAALSTCHLMGFGLRWVLGSLLRGLLLKRLSLRRVIAIRPTHQVPRALGSQLSDCENPRSPKALNANCSKCWEAGGSMQGVAWETPLQSSTHKRLAGIPRDSVSRLRELKDFSGMALEVLGHSCFGIRGF